MRGRGCGHAPNRYANWVQAQPARLNKANENFDLQKRAQPKASDLRESVQSRPAGGAFANRVQAQPAANRVRHHAVREMGAGSACRREGKAKIKKEPGRESGAASCRRELRPGSAWWWRRGELNPCPKTSPYVFLRAQFTVFALRQLPFAAHRQTGAPHR